MRELVFGAAGFLLGFFIFAWFSPVSRISGRNDRLPQSILNITRMCETRLEKLEGIWIGNKQVVEPPDFNAIVLATNSDKVSSASSPRVHNYGQAYQKYLTKFFKIGKVKLLEIVLDCNMDQGPGESLKIWTSYFKDIELSLHFLENNPKCVNAWKSKFPNVHFHTGDQNNEKTLQELLDKSGGNFDVIIDDGGHTMQQQITTLNFMFQNGLKSGGLLFMEDLLTSYIPHFYDFGTRTTTKYIGEILDDMHSYKTDTERKTKIWKSISNVDCFPELCVFEKR